MMASATAATATTTEAVAGHIQQQQRWFRILDTTLVAPSAADNGGGGPEVPLPARSIPLTFFDVKWLHHPPVERLLLYRLSWSSSSPAVDDIVSGLRASLSQALRAFYPMAGHVRMPSIIDGSGRHELCYTPGDAVPFTTAEYDVDIDQLLNTSSSGDDEVPVALLAPLVPRLPKGRRVLAVQATRLLGGGLAIGVTVHHSTCDGAGSTHFLHTWAALAAASRTLPAPPVLDRELIPDPRGLYGMYLRDMPPMVSQQDDFEFVLGKQLQDDRALATFTLSPQLLQSIKSAVAGEAARRGIMAPPPRCSSVVATYAFVWSCYCWATRSWARLAAASAPETTCYFLFSVDQRSRLLKSKCKTNPPLPLPANYFGNCCCPAIARAPSDELAAEGIAGLFTACAAVAAAVDEEVREGAQFSERWDTCVARVKAAVGTGRMLSVAGSPRFRVYDLDFGFGRPAQVHMVSVAKTSAIAVADAPAAGAAAVELGISLPGGDMERFRQSVADQTAWLLQTHTHTQ